MKTINGMKRVSQKLIVILARAFIVAGFLFCVLRGMTQSTPPVLTVAPTGTNQLSITITNAIGSANYELWWTPVLGDSVGYPWTAAAVGSMGQSNFTVNIGPYPAGFYRAVLDTNSIPLWQAADPNNQSAGILTVFIDSPTNGMVLQ